MVCQAIKRHPPAVIEEMDPFHPRLEASMGFTQRPGPSVFLVRSLTHHFEVQKKLLPTRYESPRSSGIHRWHVEENIPFLRRVDGRHRNRNVCFYCECFPANADTL